MRKSGVLEHKSGNISETRKDRGKLAWRAYKLASALLELFFLFFPLPFHSRAGQSLPPHRLKPQSGPISHPRPDIQNAGLLLTFTDQKMNENVNTWTSEE